jgi:hypothetical protein
MILRYGSVVHPDGENEPSTGCLLTSIFNALRGS